MKNVTVRRTGSGDQAALARLAALDSASPPRGPEADSRMLAALRSARAARSRTVRADCRARRPARARRAQIDSAETRARGGRLRSSLRRGVSHARA